MIVAQEAAAGTGIFPVSGICHKCTARVITVDIIAHLSILGSFASSEGY
jgi:hypothetical protein